MRFNPSPKNFTVGMEVELQLINPQTGALEQRAQDIFTHLPTTLQNNVKPELMRSVVEVISDVNDSIADLEQDMRHKLKTVLDIAEAQGLSLVGAGTHPFAHWYEQEITEDERYYRLMEQMQGIGRRLLTFGLHVHVGLDHAEKAIAIFNALIAYIPHFLSVSCNSPFWGKENVGMHSSRTKIFERLPMAGLPLSLANWSEYVWMIEMLKQNEVIESERDIHWDIRPHPVFGTIELRMCDTPCTIDEMLFIAALIQTVVADLSERYDMGERLPVPHPIIVRTNKWNTARYGLHSNFINTYGQRTSMIEDYKSVLKRLEPLARRMGTQSYLETFSHIEKMGTGSQRQLDTYEASRDLIAVVHDLNQQFKASLQNA